MDDDEAAGEAAGRHFVEDAREGSRVFSTVVGQTRRRTTPEWEPTGHMRVSAKSSS